MWHSGCPKVCGPPHIYFSFPFFHPHPLYIASPLFVLSLSTHLSFGAAPLPFLNTLCLPHTRTQTQTHTHTLFHFRGYLSNPIPAVLSSKRFLHQRSTVLLSAAENIIVCGLTQQQQHVTTTSALWATMKRFLSMPQLERKTLRGRNKGAVTKLVKDILMNEISVQVCMSSMHFEINICLPPFLVCILQNSSPQRRNTEGLRTSASASDTSRGTGQRAGSNWV